MPVQWCARAPCNGVPVPRAMVCLCPVTNGAPQVRRRAREAKRSSASAVECDRQVPDETAIIPGYNPG